MGEGNGVAACVLCGELTDRDQEGVGKWRPERACCLLRVRVRFLRAHVLASVRVRVHVEGNEQASEQSSKENTLSIIDDARPGSDLPKRCHRAECTIGKNKNDYALAMPCHTIHMHAFIIYVLCVDYEGLGV